MKTGLFYHQDCLSHLTPLGHPECAQRLKNVTKKLSEPQFSKLKRFSAPLAKKNHILLAHSETHFNNIKNYKKINNFTKIDEDTYLSSGSFKAGLRCVGAVTKAIDLVLNQRIHNAFCLTRPPGHHAEVDRAMGFCLFNNIAIGAKYALEKKYVKKIAVIDFDVHHGNGTQNILWAEKNALYISIHQSPLFPGTGFPFDKGEFQNVLNIPVEQGSIGISLHNIVENEILNKLEIFKPEFLLISSGFDGHALDPLGGLNWEAKDFSYITKTLKDFADKNCKGRIVSSLEGGYDVDSLAECCAQHILALME